jgi:hypothetical protein
MGLAQALFCKPDSLFAMINSYGLYCDAAGGKDHGFIVVAGYLSTYEKWLAFNREWNLLLGASNLPYFHMKEFAQSKGPFENWKDDEKRRAVFLSTAVGIIKGHVLRSFACLVEFDVYAKVAERYPLKELAGCPYALAARSCVAKVGNCLEGAGSDVIYVFDDGDEGKGELMRIMKRDGYPPPVFWPSRDRAVKGNLVRGMIPLQAADFAAYEIRKHIAEDPGELKPLEKYRKSIAALASVPSAASDDWGRFREQELVNLCQRFGEEHRQGG